ncbi:MAG: C25 family cysteine peptidase [Candidatus Cloacimonas sp.]
MKPYLYLSLLMIAILMLPVALYANANSADNPFELTRSANDEINIHFSLSEWEIKQIDNSDLIKQIKMSDTPYLFIDEKETLPVFSTMVAIPDRGGVNLFVSDPAKISIDQFIADFDEQLSSERQQGRLAEGLYPVNNVVISQPQILRDFRVVSINVYPFQYDQKNHNLLVTQDLDIKLTFDNRSSVNELMSSPISISESFDSIYQGLILNYDSVMQTREISYRNPILLVIYGNYSDTTYQAKINNYVYWKKQRGFIVNAVSTSVTGSTSTSIKNYIQTAYNNIATRPDYIVLIGDTDGTITVPTFSSYVDYQYTWLSGGDSLGDVMIGRISVSTTAQLDVILAKILSLEKNIGQHSTDWLDRMVLVGDSSSSGISTIYTNRFIHDISYEVNPAYTYTEQYGSPSSTSINNAINQGVAFYNYRGYIGMSGWPSTMSSLFNSYKLFHAVFITCNTGSFGGGNATTEDIIRYGSSASLGGAVTAIGMATSSTHTPMNNCLTVGIFHGIFGLGMRDMSSALLYSKLYLNLIYGVSHPTQAQNFAAYCNLMGDPTAMVYIGTPNSFAVSAPTTIPSGSTDVRINVKSNDGISVEGAFVTLTTTSGVQLKGITDSNGYVSISLPAGLAQNLDLTVTKNDFIAYSSTINVNTNGGVVFDSIIVDDTIVGNGDEIINPGEEANLYIFLKNTSASTLFVNGRVSSDDPYINLIEFDRIEFGDISPIGLVTNTTPIVFSISPNCPDQHTINLLLTAEGTGYIWSMNIPIMVRGGKLQMQNYNFVGLTGNIVTPGVTCPFTLSVKNTGLIALPNVSGRLRSLSNYFVIQDSIGYYGTLNPNAIATNNNDSFNIMVRNTSVVGMVIPLILTLSSTNGYSEEIHFTVNIGTTTVHDPLGQDAYGYFIYDVTDIGYALCPTYQWIPIAPTEGGSGTLLSFTDPGNSSDEGDATNAIAIQTVTLPFPFQFYGRQYTQASICSNGFIAFGQTLDGDWRNWRLPGAGGPNPMIAVFWDDLQFGTGSGIYTYYNSAQHYYVVEWYNIVSGYNSSSLETFEAILYDPIYYPTNTNDGQIKLQYKIFNNIDQGSGDTYPHGNYCTIGIKNHLGTDGLEYTFNNTYPTAASPLSSEKALFISTPGIISGLPHLNIAETTVIDPNANNNLEPGETADLQIQLTNNGLTDAENVTAVLTCSDPYVTLNVNTANYGNIAGESLGIPQTNFNLSISPSCPGNHTINFTISITGSGQNWIYTFTLGVYTPVLSMGTYTILDFSGDNDGTLDPGETVNLAVQLLNTGAVASPSGSANITTSGGSITITTGSVQFAPIAGNGSSELIFTLSAGISVPIGTLATLNFYATAGSYNLSSTISLEIGAPLPVIIGTGTGQQSYPIDRYYNYSAHEAIYLASEIGMPGMIKSIAYYKASGADTNPIDNVTIYMKLTSSNSLSTGNYDLNGYTLVYSGSFPNNAVSGWMEVNLNPMFFFDGVNNLSILCIKGFQSWISNYPYWTYTNTTANRARQNRSDSASPTNLSSTTNLPNLRMKMFIDDNIVFPPTALSATPGNGLVTLSWQAPVIGNVSGYKIYRNDAFYANVENACIFYDVNVVNNTTYSYYLTTVSGDNESSPTQTVQATPSNITSTQVILGVGTGFTDNTTACPVNIYNPSLHGQSVYTAAELNAAGIYGPIPILQIGFYISGLPSYPLPNFLIRMKHTATTNVSSWQSATGMSIVYANTSYMPTEVGWNMLTLSTPFQWNGTDNIVVDTAFGVASLYVSSGTVRYTTVDNGYRYCRSYSNDQTNVFSGGFVISSRPDLKITVSAPPQNPNIAVNPSQLDFGTVEIGSSATLPFTVQNTGNYLLAGYFTVPEGYLVSFNNPTNSSIWEQHRIDERDNVSFTIEPGNTLNFSVTFTPTIPASYNGNLTITSNAENSHIFSIEISGSGSYPSLATPTVNIIQGTDNIILQWNTVPNANSYQVYRSDSPTGVFTLIGTTSQLQFSDVTATKAFYYIKASSQLPVLKDNP